MMDSVWVVVPAYNEAPRIAAVLDSLLSVVPNIVVVVDGASDNTVDVALSREGWVITHPANLGQGAAIQTGIDFALSQNAAFVVTFDADGQHRATDIPRLIDALQATGCDFALASRFLGKTEGIPWTRRLLLHAAVLFTRLLSGIRVTDAHNGLRAMTRRGAERIQIRSNRMEHASEILDQIAASGLKYTEVPVRVVYSRETLAKGQRSTAALGIALRLLLNRVTR